MLELNNYYIQEVENSTDLFTIIYAIVDDIYIDFTPNKNTKQKKCKWK